MINLKYIFKKLYFNITVYKFRLFNIVLFNKTLYNNKIIIFHIKEL